MAETEVEGDGLSAIVADEIRQAQFFDQTKRALALEYMRGEMRDLPARTNGSSQTSRDVSDVLSWVLPQIVRVFTASDQMVEFEATQEGGEQAAEEASEYTNYSFFRENDGYRVLYNGTYDSLLMGNGAVCSYWCPEESKTKLFRNKTEEEIAALLDEGWQGMGIDPKPGNPRKITAEDVTGEAIDAELPTLTVKLQKITERGQIRDMTCKPENLMLNLTATTIEDARFVGYLHDDKTRSDLMAMADEYGWDEEVIQNLPRFTLSQNNEVTISRQRIDQTYNDTSPVKSGDFIDLYECYIHLDLDGDGIAELVQVWYAGNAGQGQVLSHDEWEDDIPFTDIPCYPIPHQWQADGLYDRLADIQRVKTTLLRGGIDNTYAVNFPMREVEAESVLNPDILINPKFNGLVWKKRGTAPIVNYVTEYTADKSFAAMQMMDEVITKRTGVGRGTMALDPEALQNQTATASQNQRDAQVTQSELIARNMAELGWSKWAAKRRNLAKKYIKGSIAIPSKNGDRPPQQMMQGPEGMPPDAPQPEAGKPSAYRTVQPETWQDTMAVTINVGLGTGSRDRDMAMLGSIQQDQMMIAQMLGGTGFQSEALDMLPKIAKTATQKAEAAGIKNPDSYYPAFDDQTIARMKQEAEDRKKQPPPEVQLEQMKQQGAEKLKQIDAQVTMQTEQGKLQTAQQAEQARLQVDQQNFATESEAQIRREQAQLEADLQTKEADRQNALILAQQAHEYDLQKQDKELNFKTIELATKTELEREKMANAATIAASKPKPSGKGADA